MIKNENFSEIFDALLDIVQTFGLRLSFFEGVKRLINNIERIFSFLKSNKYIFEEEDLYISSNIRQILSKEEGNKLFDSLVKKIIEIFNDYLYFLQTNNKYRQYTFKVKLNKDIIRVVNVVKKKKKNVNEIKKDFDFNEEDEDNEDNEFYKDEEVKEDSKKDIVINIDNLVSFKSFLFEIFEYVFKQSTFLESKEFTLFINYLNKEITNKEINLNNEIIVESLKTIILNFLNKLNILDILKFFYFKKERFKKTILLLEVDKFSNYLIPILKKFIIKYIPKNVKHDYKNFYNSFNKNFDKKDFDFLKDKNKSDKFVYSLYNISKKEPSKVSNEFKINIISFLFNIDEKLISNNKIILKKFDKLLESIREPKKTDIQLIKNFLNFINSIKNKNKKNV